MSSNNIKVACRIRPLNQRELELDNNFCVEVEDNKTLKYHNKQEPFEFDMVFNSNTNQFKIFQDIGKPIVDGIFEGFNGTIFAYGQTSSGKTHTMYGKGIFDIEQKGLIPRCIDRVFSSIQESQANIEFRIKVSVIEIYMEKINDLLNVNNQNLKIRQSVAKGIYIEGTTELYVTQEKDIYNLIDQAQNNRAVNATKMNSDSSRSHMIFLLTLYQTNQTDMSSKVSKLFLIDLAGSENQKSTGAQGKVLDEAIKINGSLTQLGLVINQIVEKNTFISYRSSKLTRILQESLGGNSLTSLIITVSPSMMNDFETLSTLRFGLRASKIQNRAVINKQLTIEELNRILKNKNILIQQLETKIIDLEKYINCQSEKFDIQKYFEETDQTPQNLYQIALDFQESDNQDIQIFIKENNLQDYLKVNQDQMFNQDILEIIQKTKLSVVTNKRGSLVFEIQKSVCEESDNTMIEEGDDKTFVHDQIQEHIMQQYQTLNGDEQQYMSIDNAAFYNKQNIIQAPIINQQQNLINSNTNQDYYKMQFFQMQKLYEQIMVENQQLKQQIEKFQQTQKKNNTEMEQLKQYQIDNKNNALQIEQNKQVLFFKDSQIKSYRELNDKNENQIVLLQSKNKTQQENIQNLQEQIQTLNDKIRNHKNDIQKQNDQIEELKNQLVEMEETKNQQIQVLIQDQRRQTQRLTLQENKILEFIQINQEKQQLQEQNKEMQIQKSQLEEQKKEMESQYQQLKIEQNNEVNEIKKRLEDQYKQMDIQKRQLESENIKIDQQKNQLQNENIKIEKQKTQLELNFQQIENQKIQLEQEFDQQKSQFNQIDNQKSQLEQEFQQLQYEKHKVDLEIKQLIYDKDVLQLQNQQIDYDRNNLQLDIQQYKSNIENLEIDTNQLKQELENSQNNNQQLLLQKEQIDLQYNQLKNQKQQSDIEHQQLIIENKKNYQLFQEIQQQYLELEKNKQEILNQKNNLQKLLQLSNVQKEQLETKIQKLNQDKNEFKNDLENIQKQHDEQELNLNRNIQQQIFNIKSLEEDIENLNLQIQQLEQKNLDLNELINKINNDILEQKEKRYILILEVIFYKIKQLPLTTFIYNCQ